MLKTFLSSLLLCICAASWAQKNIHNELTDKYHHIKGTKVSLVPPPGFTESHNFYGLQQESSNSSIVVFSVPGPYTEIRSGITPEGLLTQVIVSVMIDHISFNDLPAVLAEGEQKAYGMDYIKHMLVFGTSEETIIIIGAVPKEQEQTASNVRQAILTVYYDKEKALDPFDALDYTIDISGTRLKYGQNISNTLLFSVDGNIPSLSDDQTNLIVGKSFSPASEDDKKAFSLNRIRQHPLEIDNIESVEQITINGITGYEILAKGKDDNNGSQNVYQAILFLDSCYYIFLSTTNDMTGSSISEVRKAVKTFRLK